ncbi:MAG: TIR domain-containing protein [Hyphomonas sp.]|nr:TIR domain-containing protein [Hyphomonas sp.]
MADVFISYKRSERHIVERIAEILEGLGLEVWFDAGLSAGQSFSVEIDREVRAAKVVLVCWSPEAVTSEWVLSEAQVGFDKDRLISTQIAGPPDLVIPVPFNRRQKENLVQWGQAPSWYDSAWKSVLRSLGEYIGRDDIADWGKLPRQASVSQIEEWLARHGKTSQLILEADAFLKEAQARSEAEAEAATAERERQARLRAEELAREAAARAKREKEEDARRLAEAKELQRQAEQAARKSGNMTRRVLLAGTVLMGGAGTAGYLYINKSDAAGDAGAGVTGRAPTPRANSIRMVDKGYKVAAAHTLNGEGGGVYSGKFSPKGDLIATGSSDGAVRIWSAVTGELVRSWPAHERPIIRLAFSPDGSRLATASGDQTVRIWGIDGSGPLHTLEGHGQQASAVAYSPDGRRLLSGSWGIGGVRLWDAGNGKLVQTLDESGTVASVQFSPDGSKMLAAFWNGMIVKVWSTQSLKLVTSFNSTEAGFRSAAFSPDGNRIVTGANLGEVRLWDARTGEAGAILEGTSGRAYATFSGDGRMVLAGDKNSNIFLWDANSGSVISRIKGHREDVVDVDFSRDSRQFLTTSYDGFVKVWTLAPAG